MPKLYDIAIEEGECDLTLETMAGLTGRDEVADVVKDAIAVYRRLLREVLMERNNIFIGANREDAADFKITTFKRFQKE